LDAGPNVHVLYPGSEKNKVESFLNNSFKESVKEIIFDQIGKGPEKIR
jgi:diphosphomevalonate decarboxylase